MEEEAEDGSGAIKAEGEAGKENKRKRSRVGMKVGGDRGG